MCPSPASSPDVGSSPIQPAPGRYTSHQAWRSVKSCSGPVGPSSAFTSGDELDEISGNETGREAEVAQQLHEQPRGVAARAAPQLERLLGRLHPGIQPDHVPDVALHAAGSARPGSRSSARRGTGVAARYSANSGVGASCRRKRLQLLQLPVFVGERKRFGLRLEEEVERVVDRHLGDEIDLEPELTDPLGEGQSRQIVALRILLPVDEMRAWRNLASRTRIGVRQCGAGRSRTSCGDKPTRRS